MAGHILMVTENTPEIGELPEHEVEVNCPEYTKTENGENIYNISRAEGVVDLGQGNLIPSLRRGA